MSSILVIMDDGTRYKGFYVGMNQDWIFMNDVSVVTDSSVSTADIDNYIQNNDVPRIESMSLPKAKVSSIIFENKDMIDSFVANDMSVDPRFSRRRRLLG